MLILCKFRISTREVGIFPLSYEGLEIHFKMCETDCKILNIFANLHLMHVILIVLGSKHYVEYFQPVFVAETAKIHMKK